MIFKQINEIVNGTKTQTRRIVKPGEWSSLQVEVDPDPCVVYTPANKVKWCVRRDYAVQPGQGKPGVWWNGLAKTWRCEKPDVAEHSLFWEPLRITITEIRRESLQDISERDAIAEGAPPICLPGGIRVKRYGVIVNEWENPYFWYLDLWESIHGAESWQLNPDVWCISFEVKR